MRRKVRNPVAQAQTTRNNKASHLPQTTPLKTPTPKVISQNPLVIRERMINTPNNSRFDDFSVAAQRGFMGVRFFIGKLQ
jgi:hypothetical protein